MMNGFLGTRADLIIDLIMVITGFLPLLLLYSFYLASKGRYTLHKNLQLFLLLLSSIAVIALELDIRLGGVENIATQSSYYNSPTLKTVFVFHLIVAISSFFLWSWMAFKFSLLSVAKIKRTNHKLWGKILFTLLILTLVSGWAIYVMFFAL